MRPWLRTGTNIATAIVATALLATGCRAPADIAPAAGYGDPYPAPINDPQITVLSDDLRPWLGFHPAIITFNGPMAVQRPVRNLSNRQYLIDYRFIFYDAHGVELEPTMAWTMAALEPRQTLRLKANALDTSAERHRLEVKWAR